MSQDILVAFGGNLPSAIGSPAETIRAAVIKMTNSGWVIRRLSRFFRTPAFPAGNGPDYVNAAAVLRVPQSPSEVLRQLHALENEFGRARDQRWGQRTLDLDLLSFGEQVLPDPETWIGWRDLPAEEQRIRAPTSLILPHPRLAERGFVLVPLLDIVPDWQHPVSGLTVRAMVGDLDRADLEDIVPLPL